MNTVTGVSRFITINSVLALIVLLSAWYGWLSPATQFPVITVLIVIVTPLLLPLPGLLTGRPYTYQWSIFLALAYFTHGVVEAFGAPADRGYAVLEILLTLSWFLAAIVFVRTVRQSPLSTDT